MVFRQLLTSTTEISSPIMHVQWNPSLVETNGTYPFVQYNEVFLSQGLCLFIRLVFKHTVASVLSIGDVIHSEVSSNGFTVDPLYPAEPTQ